MNAEFRGKLVFTWEKILQYLPLILIILIIEGSFRAYSLVFLLLFLGIRTYQGVKALDKSGSIDQLGEQLWGKKEK